MYSISIDKRPTEQENIISPSIQQIYIKDVTYVQDGKELGENFSFLPSFHEEETQGAKELPVGLAVRITTYYT